MEKKFFPWDAYARGKASNDSYTSFCSQALKDIASGSGIQTVEPVVQTDTAEHPALNYWVYCWKHESFIERTGVAFGFGTQGFRLYRVDVDRNPKNGLEQVLYAEWDFKNPPAHFGAGFTWMDTKACEIRGAVDTWQRDTRDAQGAGAVTDVYTALVRYKNDTWAHHAHGLASAITRTWTDSAVPPMDHYRLSFSTLPEHKSRQGRAHCSWSTLKR